MLISYVRVLLLTIVRRRRYNSITIGVKEGRREEAVESYILSVRRVKTRKAVNPSPNPNYILLL